MEKQVKHFAVAISKWDHIGRDAAFNGIFHPFEEAIFNTTCKSEALKMARAYKRAWDLKGENIQYVRVISEAEYKERENGYSYDYRAYTPELIEAYSNGRKIILRA